MLHCLYRQHGPELPALPCRLEARRKAAEQRAYDDLVKDVTGTEAKASMHGQYLPTMKLQLGQGVHIAVTMGLGYALGSQFGAALSTQNPLMVSTYQFLLPWPALCRADTLHAVQHERIHVPGASGTTHPAQCHVALVATATLRCPVLVSEL